MPRRYKDFTKDILLGLATAGAIMVAASSPFFLINIAREIKRERGNILKKKLERSSMKEKLPGPWKD